MTNLLDETIAEYQRLMATGDYDAANAYMAGIGKGAEILLTPPNSDKGFRRVGALAREAEGAL